VTACASDADCVVSPATAIECTSAGPFVATNRKSEEATIATLLTGPDRGHCRCDGFEALCVTGTCGFGHP
jgi:hypothetical protein